MKLSWTPTGFSYPWWSTYNDGRFSQSPFENQAIAQVDLASQIVSLVYCDPSDLEVR